MFDALIDRFAQKAPVATMVRGLLAHSLSAERLNGIFRETSQRQYEGELLFSSVVELLSLVVTKSQKSLHAAYQRHHEELSVSLTAIYDKLAGTELAVIRALVRDTAERMRAVAQQLEPDRPSLLAGYDLRVLDGSHLAASEHRIKETRRLRGAPLPGHSLVILDPTRGLVLDMLPCADGYAQERSLLIELANEFKPGQLWIADRNFCTVLFLHEVAVSGAAFVVRRHARLPLERLGSPKSAGHCASGELFEQAGSVPDGFGYTLPVRIIRLRLDRPTESGDGEIEILTNLPATIGATAVADEYHRRWSIEAVFGELTLSLRGEIDTLGYPGAALLGYAIALMIYNLLSIVKTTIRVVHGVEAAEQISTYYLADEISSTWYGMEIVLPAEMWQERFGSCDAKHLASRLRKIAAHVDMRRYLKHPRRSAKQPRHKRIGSSPHVSTERLLRLRKK
jgi:hypothetical protein